MVDVSQQNTFPTVFGWNAETPGNRELQSRDIITQKGFSTVSSWFEADWKSWSTKQTENDSFPIEHENPNQQEAVDPNRTRPRTWSRGYTSDFAKETRVGTRNVTDQ